MLSYVAKVDPGSVPHFLHKGEDGALVFKDTRDGAHEFESYAQASHVAHEKGGYPVHVALFGGSAIMLVDPADFEQVPAPVDVDVKPEATDPSP